MYDRQSRLYACRGMKVNKRHFCLKSLRSPCLFSAKDAVHQCSVLLLHMMALCAHSHRAALPACFTRLSHALLQAWGKFGDLIIRSLLLS